MARCRRVDAERGGWRCASPGAVTTTWYVPGGIGPGKKRCPWSIGVVERPLQVGRRPGWRGSAGRPRRRADGDLREGREAGAVDDVHRVAVTVGLADAQLRRAGRLRLAGTSPAAGCTGPGACCAWLLWCCRVPVQLRCASPLRARPAARPSRCPRRAGPPPRPRGPAWRQPPARARAASAPRPAPAPPRPAGGRSLPGAVAAERLKAGQGGVRPRRGIVRRLRTPDPAVAPLTRLLVGGRRLRPVVAGAPAGSSGPRWYSAITAIAASGR